MITMLCVKASIEEFIVDCSNAIGRRAVELPKGERLAVVEVEDRAARITRHRDEAMTTEKVRPPKALAQQVEMSHTVQERQNYRSRSHGRGEGIHGGGKVVGFATQQNQTERSLDAPGQDRRRRL